MEKQRHRKRQDARNRRPTAQGTRQNPAHIRAEQTAARLLPTAERQARNKYPRLLAEIFRFLRPDHITIVHAQPQRRPRR
jgi:hypothetical protein